MARFIGAKTKEAACLIHNQVAQLHLAAEVQPLGPWTLSRPYQARGEGQNPELQCP